MKIAYLCSSIQLQQQLHHDFPEAGYIVGRSNYQCLAGNENASQCLHDGQDDPCIYRSECPYQLAKAKLLDKDVQIMNYKFFLYACNYNPFEFGGYDLVICDEVDVLEGELTQFISFMISNRMITRYNIDKPSRISNKAQNVDTIWKEWCYSTRKKLEKANVGKYFAPDTNDYKREWLRLHNIIRQLKQMEKDVSSNWIFDEKPNSQQHALDGGFEFKPVWIKQEQFEHYFGRHGQRFLMMSGSVPKDDVFLYCLGLNKQDVDIVRFDSSFPTENALMYMKFSGAMSKEKKSATMPKLLDDIKDIVEKNKEKNVLIHTVSYALQKEIASIIPAQKLLTHANNQDKITQLERFKTSRGKVFVSPSCSRGVDLPNDECRVQIICKAPYLNLGDKFTQARTYSGKMGREWYVSMCCQELIQMKGRGQRSKDDWCVNYVLDDDACKLLCERKDMFPKWFLDCVRF